MSGPHSGEGWAATSLDDLGDGPGFRKIRGAIGVTAFGINAVVLPPGSETGRHYHDRQEEVYFVHRGSLTMELGDSEQIALAPGSVVRVDAATVRLLRNTGDEDAVYVVAGGAGRLRRPRRPAAGGRDRAPPAQRAAGRGVRARGTRRGLPRGTPRAAAALVGTALVAAVVVIVVGVAGAQFAPGGAGGAPSPARAADDPVDLTVRYTRRPGGRRQVAHVRCTTARATADGWLRAVGARRACAHARRILALLTRPPRPPARLRGDLRRPRARVGHRPHRRPPRPPWLRAQRRLRGRRLAQRTTPPPPAPLR